MYSWYLNLRHCEGIAARRRTDLGIFSKRWPGRLILIILLVLLPARPDLVSTIRFESAESTNGWLTDGAPKAPQVGGPAREPPLFVIKCTNIPWSHPRIPLPVPETNSIFRLAEPDLPSMSLISLEIPCKILCLASQSEVHSMQSNIKSILNGIVVIGVVLWIVAIAFAARSAGCDSFAEEPFRKMQ
jgi:hypothetical protein